MNKQYCSKCGKCMTDERGVSLIGISIQYVIADKETGDSSAHFVNITREQNEVFVKEQFGKYAAENKYQFCWECWLDSLMGDKQ